MTYEEKESYLYNILPRGYDGDSTDVDAYLEGFGEVTSDNIDEAIRVVGRQFEHDLWQDNVGKQLLGQLE